MVRLEVMGAWAGAVGPWRPAVSGTLNQTGFSDEKASTFTSEKRARLVLREVLGADQEVGGRWLRAEDTVDGEAAAIKRGAPVFRIVETHSPAPGGHSGRNLAPHTPRVVVGGRVFAVTAVQARLVREALASPDRAVSVGVRLARSFEVLKAIGAGRLVLSSDKTMRFVVSEGVTVGGGV